MDGLVNVAGKRTVTFELNGKTYTMTPKVLDEYAERERYILNLKPHPLTLLDQLTPLPPPPTMPIPPDNLTDIAALKKHRDEIARYQQDKLNHDAAINRREKLEQSLRKEAMRPQVVSFEDDQLFDQSLHGIAFKLWRALRDHHPEIDSVQAALSLLEQIGDQRLVEINSKLDLAEEKDTLGNSNGSGRAEPTPAEYHGGTSTANSPGGMDGPLSTSDE